MIDGVHGGFTDMLKELLNMPQHWPLLVLQKKEYFLAAYYVFVGKVYGNCHDICKSNSNNQHPLDT